MGYAIVWLFVRLAPRGVVVLVIAEAAGPGRRLGGLPAVGRPRSVLARRLPVVVGLVGLAPSAVSVPTTALGPGALSAPSRLSAAGRPVVQSTVALSLPRLARVQRPRVGGVVGAASGNGCTALRLAALPVLVS